MKEKKCVKLKIIWHWNDKIKKENENIIIRENVSNFTKFVSIFTYWPDFF